MGLFNFNKKRFLSKLSSDQHDEILITLILLKQMIDADGVEKPEEKEYYKKYLINCGISSKEELESILDSAANLTADQYDLIVNDFDKFQKLTILQELYGIICSDNEINQDELDLLFHISRDMGIDDDIIVDMLGAKKDLLEKFNESKDDSESKNVLDKFCSECGNQFESDQKFCPNCGNKRNIDELDKGELKDKVETDQENKQKIIEEAKAIIDKLKNNELEIRVNQRENLLCQFQFNEEFKSYAERDEFKEHSKSYGETEAFDYSCDNDIERYVSNPELYSSLKTFSGWLELWQVFKVPNDAFIEHVNHFIQSVKEDCEYYGQYKSVEDYLEEAVEWDGEYNGVPYSEHTLGFNGPKLKECFIGFLKEENKGYEVKIDFFDITNKKNSEDSDEYTVYIKSNEELRLILNGIDKDEINSFSVDILYDKWTFFEEINYKGTFKGFDFILKGGSAIKWSKHKGCYKDDIDTFLNDINSKEISELDFQTLNYDCEDSDEDYDYNFFNKIVWDENTPEEIIKDVEKNYSENKYEKLRDEIELEEEFLDIELLQDKGLINQLSISISYKNNIKNLKWVKDENIQDTSVNEESKFSFNKVQALKQIELNWIKGSSPIYSVSLTELFKHPGRTLCHYTTDEESDFYEGEHISIIVKSIPEGKDLIDFIINQNGEKVSFKNIDNNRKIHKLGYLFDISLVEPEDFDFPIVEINRRKKLDYTSARGEEILHGIHVKSDSIKSKIKGFKKLILNNGELVADGRYTSDANAQKIDSWHSDFSTAFNDVNQVLEVNDPTNEFLKLNIEEAKNKIIDSGFSYITENFEMNFYKGNSSWWVNFNLN